MRRFPRTPSRVSSDEGIAGNLCLAREHGESRLWHSLYERGARGSVDYAHAVRGPAPGRLRASTASDSWTFPRHRRCSSRLDWYVTGRIATPSSITNACHVSDAGSSSRSVRSAARRGAAIGIPHTCHGPRRVRCVRRRDTARLSASGSDLDQCWGRPRRIHLQVRDPIR